MENLNPNIIKLEYAVRGPLVIRAAEIEKEIEKVSFSSLPINFVGIFYKIVSNAVVFIVNCID